MSIPNDTPSMNSFNIKLHLVSGNADLYFKACEHTVNCSLDSKDYKKANKVKGIRVAPNSGSEKEIL